MTNHVRRRTILRSLPASVAPLSGCAAPTASGPDRDVQADVGWPMFQYDSRNTGCSTGDGPPTRYPSRSWTYETAGQVWGSPVAVDGLVYIGSYDHHLYALDADTGEPEWRFETEDRIDGTPAVRDGTVYFGSFDGNVYALDATTGEKRWDVAMNGIVRSSPTIVDDTVFVGGNCQRTECEYYYDEPKDEHGLVYALDRHTGDVAWEYETEGGLMSTPAVDRGTVYIGCEDSKIYALDASRGDKVWEYVTGDMVMSSPTISDGTLYVGSNDGNVYALDTATGDETWVFETGGQYVSSSPSICEDTVYIGSSGVPVDQDGVQVMKGIVYALSADTGDEIRAHVTDAQEVGSTPTIVDDTVYVGSHSQNGRFGAMHSIRLNGGDRWVHEVEGVGVGSSAAVAEGSLYVGSANGNVYAFD